MALPALERCTGERRNASVVNRSAPSPSTRSMYNTSPPDGTPSCTVSPIAFRNSTSNGSACVRSVERVVTSWPYSSKCTPSRYWPLRVRSSAPRSTSTPHVRCMVLFVTPTRRASSLNPISASAKNASRMSRAIVTERRAGFAVVGDCCVIGRHPRSAFATAEHPLRAPRVPTCGEQVFVTLD